MVDYNSILFISNQLVWSYSLGTHLILIYSYIVAYVERLCIYTYTIPYTLPIPIPVPYPALPLPYPSPSPPLSQSLPVLSLFPLFLVAHLMSICICLYTYTYTIPYPIPCLAPPHYHTPSAPAPGPVACPPVPARGLSPPGTLPHHPPQSLPQASPYQAPCSYLPIHTPPYTRPWHTSRTHTGFFLFPGARLPRSRTLDPVPFQITHLSRPGGTRDSWVSTWFKCWVNEDSPRGSSIWFNQITHQMNGVY